MYCIDGAAQELKKACLKQASLWNWGLVPGDVPGPRSDCFPENVVGLRAARLACCPGWWGPQARVTPPLALPLDIASRPAWHPCRWLVALDQLQRDVAGTGRSNRDLSGGDLGAIVILQAVGLQYFPMIRTSMFARRKYDP